MQNSQFKFLPTPTIADSNENEKSVINMERKQRTSQIDYKIQVFQLCFLQLLSTPNEDSVTDACLACREAWVYFWSDWENYIDTRKESALLFVKTIDEACKAASSQIEPMNDAVAHCISSMRKKYEFVLALVERRDVSWVRSQLAA